MFLYDFAVVKCAPPPPPKFQVRRGGSDTYTSIMVDKMGVGNRRVARLTLKGQSVPLDMGL